MLAIEFFLIKFVNNEAVYACNLCTEGFEYEESVRNHMEREHMRVCSLSESQKSSCNSSICMDMGKKKCVQFCFYSKPSSEEEREQLKGSTNMGLP